MKSKYYIHTNSNKNYKNFKKYKNNNFFSTNRRINLKFGLYNIETFTDI